MGLVVALAAYVQSEELPGLGGVKWQTKTRRTVVGLGLALAAAGVAFPLVATRDDSNETVAEADESAPANPSVVGDISSDDESPTIIGDISSGDESPTIIGDNNNVTIEGDSPDPPPDDETAQEPGTPTIDRLDLSMTANEVVFTASILNDSDSPATIDNLYLGELMIFDVAGGDGDDCGGYGLKIWFEETPVAVVAESDDEVLTELSQQADNLTGSFPALAYNRGTTCSDNTVVEIATPIALQPREVKQVAVSIPSDFSVLHAVEQDPNDVVREEMKGTTSSLLRKWTLGSDLAADFEGAGMQLVSLALSMVVQAEDRCSIVTLDALAPGLPALDPSDHPAGGLDGANLRDALCSFVIPSL